MDGIKDIFIINQRAPYDQFIEQMERIGLKRLPYHLHEKDVDISDNDDAIFILAKDCESITIRGIADSRIKRKLHLEPHNIYLKIHDEEGNEVKSDDAVQFSITEFKKIGLDNQRTVYYYYPYKMANAGLKIKRGIIITKDRRLELRVIRYGNTIKIGKIEVTIDCDKWVDEKDALR